MDFITISYNQEAYIIQHLESVKYQIQHYAGDREVSFRLFDDNSADNTVLLARRWLNENSSLFCSVEIVVNNKNLGLNQNFLQAVRSAGNRPFKCLAADDIYNWRSVFDAAESPSVLLTPVIRFSDNGAPCFSPSVEYIYFACQKANTRRLIESRLAYSASIETPGVFFPSGFFSCQSLITEVNKYRFIEDLPIWKWLFFSDEGKKHLVSSATNPLILYRVGSGITSKHNKSHSSFDNERVIAESELHIKRWSRPLLLNPGRVINLLSWRVYNLVVRRFLSSSRELHSFFRDELDKAESHLCLIRSRAKEFED